MYLRESFEAIVKEHDIGPMDYNEAMSDVDVHLWQRVMETKLESIYSIRI